jgi:hypothetical protein
VAFAVKKRAGTKRAKKYTTEEVKSFLRVEKERGGEAKNV